MESPMNAEMESGVKNAAKVTSANAALIYIVDDQVDLVELVSILLGRLGFRTQKFVSPLSAYAAFVSAEPKPDLLLVDYSMPEMNGLEFLRRCRAIGPKIKAITISGNLTTELLSDSDVKPDLLLGKPFTAAELQLAVRTTLGQVWKA